MSYNTVYPHGDKVSISVIAADSVIVKSIGGLVKVFQVVGYPNRPDSRTELASFTNSQTTVGPFASGATLEIEAAEAQVQYAAGVAPIITDGGKAQYQTTPGVLNATGAMTAAMILSGIVTSTTGAAVAGTVPLGTVMELASEWAIDDSFDFTVIATGGNAFTVTAATGITIVGDPVVATVTSGLFRLRKTAADVFVIYRLAQ